MVGTRFLATVIAFSGFLMTRIGWNRVVLAWAVAEFLLLDPIKSAAYRLLRRLAAQEARSPPPRLNDHLVVAGSPPDRDRTVREHYDRGGDDVRMLMFRALVTIEPVAAQTWQVPSETHHLVIRAHRTRPELIRHYSAVICTDDQEPLLPGDAGLVVTMTVTDETAIDILLPGQHFELWEAHKLGHGVITRRVFM